MIALSRRPIRPIRLIATATALVAGLVMVFSAPANAAPVVSGDVGLEVDDAPKRVSDTADLDARAAQSVPYPSGALYLNRGVCGAFLGGKHQKGMEQSLYQWQGEVGYYYTPWFSGGVGFRIRAGEPSDTQQKILNRYFLLTRFHKSWATTHTAIYIGPQLGLDNLNVLDGAPQVRDSVSSIISKPLDNTNASLGLDMGGGWKFCRWMGATLGTNMEFSLVGEDSLSKNNALNVHVNPGVAIDILAFASHLKELVPAMYVNIELQLGFLLLEENRQQYDRAVILGIALAF